MSGSPDEERARIREQKREQLKAKLSNEGDSPPAEATESHQQKPIEIDHGDHLETIVSSNQTVLVDCYADWCGPCQMMEPMIDALAAESEAVVAKVDVDTNQQLAQQLGARGVPTLLLYVDGKPVERLVGAQDRATLDALIAEHS